MKLLRTIHFDASDNHVFEVTAPSDEWAISGGGAFAAMEREEITGKVKQAFSNGFLGIPSFGRCTFASVAEVTAIERGEVARTLAQHFMEFYGVEELSEATAVADEELTYIEELCEDALINTIFTVRRTFDDNGGIREAFRTIQPPTDTPLHSRIWTMVDDDV